MSLVSVCKTTDVEPGTSLRVEIDGLPALAVFNVENEFFVIDDTCTHGDASLCDGEIEDGQVIMSRWPLSYAQMIWFDVPYGRYDNDAMTDFSELSAGMLKAEFAYGDKQITLLNVHGPWHLAGDDDTPRRQVMVRSILDNLGEHTVLAGDFNAQPSVASMKKLALRLINLFDGDLTTSFNVKRKDLAKFPGYATAVVDMAFTTPNWRLLAKQVPQVDVSDHLPLVFEIEPI